MKKINNEKIYVQNDYIDEILEYPENYELYEILFASLITPYKYKLYDFILLNYGMYDDAETFKSFLIRYNLYDDYINRVCSGNDVVLKANLVMFLESDLFTPIFEDVPNFIEKVTNYEECPAKNKLYSLTALSSYKCSDEEIESIKNSINYLISNDEYFNEQFNKKEISNVIDIICKQIDKIHEENKGENKMYIKINF